MSYWQAPTGGGGYTCSLCGGWAPWNTVHECGSYRQEPVSQPRWDKVSDVRIADALERIADALQRIAKDC